MSHLLRLSVPLRKKYLKADSTHNEELELTKPALIPGSSKPSVITRQTKKRTLKFTHISRKNSKKNDKAKSRKKGYKTDQKSCCRSVTHPKKGFL